MTGGEIMVHEAGAYMHTIAQCIVTALLCCGREPGVCKNCIL